MTHNPYGQSRGGKEVAQGHAVQSMLVRLLLQESFGKAALGVAQTSFLGGVWTGTEGCDASAAAACSNKGKSIIAILAWQCRVMRCHAAWPQLQV